MSHLFFYAILLLNILFPSVYAQKTWDGEGNDNQWSNPSNWADNIVPQENDIVLLDNSVIHTSYTIELPGGNTTVTVRGIRIAPDISHNIELILPALNTSVPALVASGPGYGLDIGRGGVFRNASGAASGTPVSVSDSIRIANGGRFIHNTPRSHAANVAVLSAAPGTEQGIMEFDVPDPSSTISLSGRIFGALHLRSVAAGGALKYTGAGTNPVIIRSDLVIGDSVGLGLNFSDTIFVNGNLINNGTVDLGNTARNVVLALYGDMQMSPGAVFTSTGTSTPEILLHGKAAQQLTIHGIISHQVALTLNSQADVILNTPLTLPYSLSLVRGRLSIAVTGALTLAPSCNVYCDTLAATSFINGALTKLGLNNNDFVFPVGKGTGMRWIKLNNATGDFTAEYYNSDPYALGNIIGQGLDHVSRMEYWRVVTTGTSIPVTTLSFHDPNSGGVTSLTALRVATLTGGVWKNAGSTAFSGSAGGDGWVSSTTLSGFSAENMFFALASAIGQENPLPISSITLRAERDDRSVDFRWNIYSDGGPYRLELQQSFDNRHFTTVDRQLSASGNESNTCRYNMEYSGEVWFRLMAIGDHGAVNYYSNIVRVAPKRVPVYALLATIANHSLPVAVVTNSHTLFRFSIYNMNGALVKTDVAEVAGGAVTLQINVSSLSPGWYYLREMDPKSSNIVLRFLKR